MSLSCTFFEISTRYQHLFAKNLRRQATFTTPTSGTVCHHKANTYRANRAQNLMTLASAIPEIFQEVRNSGMYHVVLPRPLGGQIKGLKVNTSCGQTVRKI